MLLVDERAKTKVYPLLLSCLATGAVHTRVVYGYSTSAFLLQWDHFVAERGRPTKLAKSINWESVEGRETVQETTWEYAPTGHQWRNGRTKARVKAGKATLKHMVSRTLRGE